MSNTSYVVDEYDNDVFSKKNEPKEVYDVIGGISDAFDAKGYPKDANINVVKQIKLKNFVITIQRRQK